MINISEFKKAYFNIDNCQDYYEGYYIPHKRWNGWAMPYFSKKIADKIIKKAQADDMKIVYDKKSQSYKVTDYVQGVEDDSYEFEKVVIDTPEGKKSLYGVGAGYWVWDDYSLDEIDNPNAIIHINNNKKYEKSYFTTEFDKIFYEGYHIPNKKDKWAKPYFTREIADILAKDIFGYYEQLIYDKEKDEYIYQSIDTDEVNRFKKTIIKTPEGIKEVYGIGAGSWIWENKSIEEIEPNRIIIKQDNQKSLSKDDTMDYEY